MSGERKNNTAWATHMQVTRCLTISTLFISTEESAAITAAPRQLYKRHADRKREAEFALFSFIHCKNRCSLSPLGNRQQVGRSMPQVYGSLLGNTD